MPRPSDSTSSKMTSGADSTPSQTAPTAEQLAADFASRFGGGTTHSQPTSSRAPGLNAAGVYPSRAQRAAQARKGRAPSNKGILKKPKPIALSSATMQLMQRGRNFISSLSANPSFDSTKPTKISIYRVTPFDPDPSSQGMSLGDYARFLQNPRSSSSSSSDIIRPCQSSGCRTIISTNAPTVTVCPPCIPTLLSRKTSSLNASDSGSKVDKPNDSNSSMISFFRIQVDADEIPPVGRRITWEDFLVEQDEELPHLLLCQCGDEGCDRLIGSNHECMTVCPTCIPKLVAGRGSAGTAATHK